MYLSLADEDGHIRRFQLQVNISTQLFIRTGYLAVVLDKGQRPGAHAAISRPRRSL
jgi:hypothetical protein